MDFTPRKYQSDLADYCTKKNSIIYLPTGSGKTYIAILLIKRYSPTVQRPIDDGGKRIIFMCNTVELASQQALLLRKCLNLNIGLYTGDRGVDNWKLKEWHQEMNKSHVLVGTSQVFLDAIYKNYMKVSYLSLVVIDECHHALKQHPMNAFLQTFSSTNIKDWPRVVGLSGVLFVGNKYSNVINDLKSLEASFKGQIITIRNNDEYQNVLLYSTNPTEEVVTFSTNDYRFEEMNIINCKVQEIIRKVQLWDIGSTGVTLSKGLNKIREPSKKNNIINMLNDYLYQMDNYGLYAASIAILSPIIEFEIKKRTAETVSLRKLYRFCIAACENILHIITKKLKEFSDDEDTSKHDYHTEECIINFSTEKLRAFLSYITKKFSNKKKDDICCLVFVERRYTAKCLYYILKKYAALNPQLSSVIFPEFMVGRNSISQNVELVLERKWNVSVMEKFRNKQCNVIICSNVLEEGIDVQSCNFVFNLDPIKTFNSYVQTMGRARSPNAIYGIFTPSSDQLKTIEKINTYKKIHKLIKDFLHERILDDNDKFDNLRNIEPDDKYHFVTASGAQIKLNNALRIVASYCTSLPSDAFGFVNARYILEKANETDCVVLLNLPLQSKVKSTIKSDVMRNVKLAKMSAAFKACVELYKLKELNERLDPISQKDVIADTADVLFGHWKKFNDNVTKMNINNNKVTIVQRMCPEVLFNAVPSPGERCYVYELNFTPQFEKNEYNEHIFNIFKSTQTLALLLRKKLPLIAEMPLFLNQGQVNIKVSDCPIQIEFLTEEQLNLIRQHQITFTKDILDCWNPFYVVDSRNEENSFYIVPMIDSQIHWAIIKKFQTLPTARSYTVAERSNKIYKPEDYLGNIVTKWYDGNQTAFVVTKVCTSLTPLSNFEDDSYTSYANYMEQKYSQSIDKVVNRHQFLIEVKELTKRTNFFANAVGKTQVLNKLKRKVTLIPELCHNYEYPADLWLRILMLPSFLHRFPTMLHAEELRVRLNNFLGVDKLPANSKYKPKPLQIDISLRRAVDFDGNVIDEIQTTKRTLSLLPTKSKVNFENNLKLSEEYGWKRYLEPCDHNRLADTLYTVDIDYVYKFNAGLACNVDSANEYQVWSTSQLEMVFNQFSSLSLENSENVMQSIEDVPLPLKQRIEILEISLGSTDITPMEQCELTAALTTSKTGDVYDMERFEVLGDSFLKLSSSIYLVNRYPTWHEGLLTQIKSLIVSNRNLIYCLRDTDIPQRIQSSQLRKPKYDWLPPIVSLPVNIIELLNQKDGYIKNFTSKDIFEIELNENEVKTGICSVENLNRFVSSCNANSVEYCDADDDVHYLINKSSLQNKVIADTLEAILGVVVKNYGIHYGFKVLEYFGIFKKDTENLVSDFLDLQLESRQLRTDIPKQEVDSFLINYEYLEKNLNYQFKDRAYLLQALTHPSFPTNRLTGCYQELEFIGDAILDFLITTYIFERFEKMTPGMLTDLRSALVNNVTLACICVRHRFHLFLLSENSALTESINVFESFQKSQNYLITDHVRILTEETFQNTCSSNQKTLNIAESVDVPKALGDVVEALIAAVYLDSRNLGTTWNVIFHLFEYEIRTFSQNVPISPVRELYEHKYAKPKFGDTCYEDDICLVTCEFTCLDQLITVNGFGKNAKQAKISAAKMALKILHKYSN